MILRLCHCKSELYESFKPLFSLNMGLMGESMHYAEHLIRDTWTHRVRSPTEMNGCYIPTKELGVISVLGDFWA
jgi:hypothetical protein